MRKSESAASLSRSASSLSSSQFELLEQIGSGSFGSVFRALHRPSNKECAIKRIDLESSDDDIEEIQKEIAILAECNDPHITRYFGCFMHEFELWIVMEYLGGGSCLDLLKNIKPSTLPESVIAEILAQVVTGLAYLHGSGKIHRDIKAANVLIAETGEVKIADFGVAAQLSSNLSRRNTFVGTPFWMAPEVINQLDYHFSADIWSLGITAFELAYGKPPWSHLHPMKALFSIPRNDPPRLDDKFSPEFQDFVAQCLRMSSKERATVTDLMKHPFLARRDRQALLHLLHQSSPILDKPREKHSKPSKSTLKQSNGATASRRKSTLRGSAPSSSSSSEMSSRNGSKTINSISSKTAVDRADHCDSADSQSTVFSVSSHSNAQSSSSEHTDSEEGTDKGKEADTLAPADEDDWDFDTIKPQPSLEQILQNPPATSEIPPPIPSPLAKTTPSNAYNTVDSFRGGTTTLAQPGSQSLVRIFSHASRKFGDPMLDEISDLLRADPLTINVENYLLRRIGKYAVQQLGIKAKDRPAPFDDVERILLDKWIEEVQELHNKH